MDQKPQPQEQGPEGEIMQRMVIAAMKLLYENPQTVQQIAQSLQGDGDKAQAIASISMTVVEQLRSSMSGVNPDAAYAMAPIVAALVAEIGVKSGGMPDDPKILATAIVAIRDQLMQKAGQQGKQPPAEAQPAQTTPAAGIVNQAMGG